MSSRRFKAPTPMKIEKSGQPENSSPNKPSSDLNSISSTIEDRNNEFTCPICFDIIKDAHITRCGHTFCMQCITKAIARFQRCPKCSLVINSTEMIFPNFVVDELILKYKTKISINNVTKSEDNVGSVEELKKFLSAESQKLSLFDVNIILDILNQRKQILEAESNVAQNRLLYEFLKHLLKQKEEQQAHIQKEIKIIKTDLKVVENTLKNIVMDEEMDNGGKLSQSGEQGSENLQKELLSSNTSIVDECNSVENIRTTFQSRKRRMHSHFDDFVVSYFSARNPTTVSSTTNSNNCQIDSDDKMKNTCYPLQGLDIFRENLVKFSRYSNVKPLATMHYSCDLHASSTIVSTIVFDKDNEYFAIGGVTKRIKVYDYFTVIRDIVDIHYPCIEMVSNSKISCIAWNSQYKNILASSDYEGTVNIWDVSTGQRTKCFHEHEKRCWSVDFNDVDTKLIVSGSDDARVKLWSLKDEHSIATLEAKANVCCVKFNPRSSCHLAFGSADHDVHYYDLRNMNKAVCVFRGHKKAVSYVKFLNNNEIVSASTDSQLKLWNVNSSPYWLRSFTGHINEKNFVGLTTDGDYIACGSEDNSLYVYYKGLSKPLLNYKIDVAQGASDLERSNDINDFVSAVCWRKQCNVILAANSRGIIKILELV